jgi:hypothetical protein
MLRGGAISIMHMTIIYSNILSILSRPEAPPFSRAHSLGLKVGRVFSALAEQDLPPSGPTSAQKVGPAAKLHMRSRSLFWCPMHHSDRLSGSKF